MLDFVPAFLMDFAVWVAVFTLQHMLADRLLLAAEPPGQRLVRLAILQGTFTTVYVLGSMLLGPITDRRGRRRTSIALGAAVAGGVPLLVLVANAHGNEPLFLGMGVLGVGASLFWPAYQARVAERAGPAGLGPALARFNLGWTGGKALGLVLAGILFASDARGSVGLLVAASAAIACSAICLLDREAAKGEGAPGARSASKDAAARPLEEKRGFLLAALSTNLAVWGLQATVNALVPELGLSLHLDAPAQGALLGLLMVAQAGTFFVLRGTSGWSYRRGLLLATTPLAVATGLAFFLASVPWHAFAAALVAGLLTGSSYSASLFYSLDYDERRGFRMGVNEAVLGVGGLLPMLGSEIASRSGVPRAPYLVAATVCLVAFFVTAVCLGGRRMGPRSP